MIQSTDEMIIFHIISTLQSAFFLLAYHMLWFSYNRLKACLLPLKFLRSLIKPSCFADTWNWQTFSYQDSRLLASVIQIM